MTIAVTPEVAWTGVAKMLANGFSAESKVSANVIVTEANLVPDLVRKGVQRTPLLHNDVTMLLSASPSPRPNADWFVQWIMSYRGRDAIQRYRYGAGQHLFVEER